MLVNKTSFSALLLFIFLIIFLRASSPHILLRILKMFMKLILVSLFVSMLFSHGRKVLSDTSLGKKIASLH